MTHRFKTAVIGVGHMGRHHARVYSELPNSELVAIVDIQLDRAKEFARQYNCQACATIDEIKTPLDAVSIAVPTVHHRAIAEPLLARRIAVLIEKPIAPNIEESVALLKCSQKHDALLQIGHSERFNPVVTTLKRMNIRPKFIETHRISPFTFRSADIGVVFDMMIHDIDIVLNLVQCYEYSVQAVGVPVMVRDHEDVANAWISFANGCVANLTASRLAMKTERKIRAFSEDAYVHLDYAKKTGIAVTKDANLDILKLAREGKFEDMSQMKNFDFGSMIRIEPLEVDDIEPLRAELSSFLHALETGGPPEVSGEEGVEAVKLASRIVDAVKQHKWNISV